jgi:3-phenylpropionate/cinnamic acid dioxygenase small subunit
MSGIETRRVADELEIRNLVARLAHLADHGELSEYIALFTEDAVWGFQAKPGQAATYPLRHGRADILAGAKDRRSSGTTGPGSHSRHVLTSTWVKVEGDSATSGSYLVFYRNCNAVPELVNFSVYADRFRRTPEGWRLAERLIELG